MFCVSSDILEIKDTYLKPWELFKICTYIVKMLIKLLSLKRQASKHLLVSVQLYIYKQVGQSTSKSIKKQCILVQSKEANEWHALPLKKEYYANKYMYRFVYKSLRLFNGNI